MAKKVKEAPVEEVLQAEVEAETVQAETAPDPEELVAIKLFKDNDKYKDDVFVGVNGEGCLIKRGEKVMIKRKFAEVLEHSAEQDEKTAALIAQRTEEFDGIRRVLEE